MTAELSRGRSIILLDNVGRGDGGRQLDSQVLACILTAPIWTDRILGVSKMVSIPNRALWLLTGNNLRFSMELVRRSVGIRIDPVMDRPWLRDEKCFRHPDLLKWVRESRVDLVKALLILTKAWLAADRPKGKTRIGSFESWSAVMGGILQVAGIPGLLSNLSTLYETADAEGQVWREFVEVWWEKFQDRPQRVSELHALCVELDLMAGARGDGTTQSQNTRLGLARANALARASVVVSPAAEERINFTAIGLSRVVSRASQMSPSAPLLICLTNLISIGFLSSSAGPYGGDGENWLAKSSDLAGDYRRELRPLWVTQWVRYCQGD